MKDRKGKRFVNQAFPDTVATTTSIITIVDHPLELRAFASTNNGCQPDHIM
jgi:hypothetical protein